MSDELKIVPRSEHNISRQRIHPAALKVLYRLREAGYEAYLVGGGVRDMLLEREPKDFDVVTNARPEEIKAEFSNCRLIGRRFRLAHVRYGKDIVEVATFRGAPTSEDDDVAHTEEGRILRDNVYGTLEQDVWRRDFTVNSLYYSIRDFSVVDHVGGMEDLKRGVLRLIGDPEKRYREDPVRMLRAVRFAVKLGFVIEPATEAPLFELGGLLDDIAPARLYEEVLKLFLGGDALGTFEKLQHYGLFKHLFPDTDAALSAEDLGLPHAFIKQSLSNTDTRISQDKPVTPAFLFAALLWVPMLRDKQKLLGEGATEFQATQEATARVVRSAVDRISLPKRFSIPMREIWQLQPRLAQTRGRRPLRLVQHPRFRAAYDFLLLRIQAGEPLAELGNWWARFQETGDEEKTLLLEEKSSKSGPRRRRRRRRAPQSAKNDSPG